MSDLLSKLNEVNQRLAESIAERSRLEQEANALEAKARQNRVEMAKLKDDIAMCQNAIRDANIAAKIANEQELASKARAEAERARNEANAALDRIAKKEAELTVQIEALKATSKTDGTGN